MFPFSAIPRWKAVLKTRALQTLRDCQGVSEPREASGVRRVHRRFPGVLDKEGELFSVSLEVLRLDLSGGHPQNQRRPTAVPSARVRRLA